MTRSVSLILAAAFAGICFTGCERHPQTPAEKFNHAIEEAHEAAEELKQEAQESIDEIDAALETDNETTVGTKISESLEDAGDAIEEGAEDLQEATGEVLEAAGEKLEDAGRALKSGVEHAGQTIEETVDG